METSKSERDLLTWDWAFALAVAWLKPRDWPKHPLMTEELAAAWANDCPHPLLWAMACACMKPAAGLLLPAFAPLKKWCFF